MKHKKDLIFNSNKKFEINISLTIVIKTDGSMMDVDDVQTYSYLRNLCKDKQFKTCGTVDRNMMLREQFFI